MTATAPGRGAVRGEFGRGWRTILGCALGGAVGVVALPNAVVALLMHDLQADLGWSRSAMSVAPTILFATLALTTPLAGWIADRVEAAWLVTCSLAAMCVGFLLFSRMGHDIRLFYAGFAALAFTGAGASPLSFARIISARFQRARGAALGVAMLGNGLSGAVISILLIPLSAAYGWRSGYLGLAALLAVVTPMVFLLLRPHGSGARGREAPARTSAPRGAFAAILRQPAFWLLTVGFTATTFATIGFALHYVAFMLDAGLSPRTAGALSGLGGLAVVLARLGAGWLLDRVFAPTLAAAVLAASSACFVGLALGGAGLAALGAVALGLAVGSEVDLMGYMTARYFGLEIYGRAYGVIFGCTLVGSAVSPVAYGLLFDLGLGYRPAFLASAALLILGAGIMLALPPYPPRPAAGMDTAPAGAP